MNKQMLAIISGLLSFTVGIAMAFVLGMHTETSIPSGAPILCEKNVYAVAPATRPQISPSHDWIFQEQVGEQSVELNRIIFGKIFWTGTVTGKTNIVIYKSRLSFQTLSGTATTSVERQISTMPARPMGIRLKDVTGKVRIFQAPNASNGFITIVQVEGNHDVVSFALDWTILR